MTARQVHVIEGRSRWDGVAMTLKQYLALPEEKPYLEYIHGRVVQKAVPSWDHAELQPFVASLLLTFARTVGARVATELHTWFEFPDGPAYLLPDISYYAPGKPRGTKERALPPTLAVEIRSPDDAIGALRDKCRLMRAHGVDACWLIDPERRTAEVFEGVADGALQPADGTLASEFLPGLRLPLAELWAAID